MSRSEQKQRISTQEIKDRWEEIYAKYVRLTKDGRGMVGLCPLHEEHTPSFHVTEKGGFRCFGCGKNGSSVIDFIMQKYNLDFVEAINYIIKDNNISPTEKVIVQKPKIIREESLIEWNIGRFEAKHKKYWNKYLIPESYLNSKGIYAVRKLAYNKKVIDIKDETVFVYIAEDINKPKILRIGEHVDKKDKWRTKVPNDYLWWFPKEHVKRLFIAKSVKDAAVLEYHFGLKTTATQNEDATILLQNNYERIEAIADEKVVAYGSDFQGWHESYIITFYTNWNYFNVPCALEKMGIVDPSDLVDQIGLEPLRELLLKKNYI